MAMRRLMTRPYVVAALAALVAGGATVIPAQAANADTPTYCSEGVNAGYSNGGSGSTFWGWCYAAAGQYVNFSVDIQCSNGGGGQTTYASGSGPGTVYTQGETCWFGGHVS